jgi:Arc/MetJ-type ribon-helix-helix transcriptional regulator
MAVQGSSVIRAMLKRLAEERLMEEAELKHEKVEGSVEAAMPLEAEAA